MFDSVVKQKFLGEISGYEVDDKIKFDHLRYILDNLESTFKLKTLSKENQYEIVKAFSDMFDTYAYDQFYGSILEESSSYETVLINFLEDRKSIISEELNSSEINCENLYTLLNDEFFNYNY